MADKPQLKALCMGCRTPENKPTKDRLMDVELVEKNVKGRYSAKGKCTVCGGNMFKFLSEADAMKLKDEGATYKEAA